MMTSPARVEPPVERMEEEPKATFMEHLEELRKRIFRGLIYIMLGWTIGFAITGYVYNILAGPLLAVKPEGAKFVFTHATEPFFLKFKLALVIGLILAMPLLMRELWGFLSPGLTKQEKRSIKLIAPFSLFLFFSGVALGYYILPAAFNFFLSYLNEYPEAQLFQNPGQYVMFVVKMMLAFGLGFQMPVVLMFLAHIGVATPETMWKYWRQAIVGIGVLAALLTPSGDAFSMLAIGLPMVFLYFLSIMLVGRIVKKKRQQALRVETKQT